VKQIRALKLVLAGANLLLGAGIVLFAALFLFVRVPGELDLPTPAWDAPGATPVPAGDRALTEVSNPLAPSEAPLPPGLSVALLGTLPHDAAFFRSGKDEFVAFVGERVGEWRLEEVARDRAVLTLGSDRRVVRLDETAPPRESPPRRPR
jgi:hypothetical protein